MKELKMKLGSIIAITMAALFATSNCAFAEKCKGSKNVNTVSTTVEKKEAAEADIVDTAVEAGNFTTLVAAVKSAGLVETLKGKGPFTVFAPTDAAFKKLPEGTVETLLKKENKDKLIAILTYHVVPGKVMAADVVKLSEAKSVQGGEIKIEVKDGKVFLNGKTQVVTTDIKCKNGVIHVIDSVILPPEKN
jgi:uncharacterized surface protein with fasciclin (FAS1) repeats